MFSSEACIESPLEGGRGMYFKKALSSSFNGLKRCMIESTNFSFTCVVLSLLDQIFILLIFRKYAKYRKK